MFLDRLIVFLTRYINELHQNSIVRLLGLKKNVSLDKTIKIGKQTDIILESDYAQLIIGSHFYTRSFCTIRVCENGRLVIGNNVFLNNFCSINCMQEIKIGDNVMFGENVKLYDHNHRIEKGEVKKTYRDKFNCDPIIISDGCWIGSNVTILKGVRIGKNAIIGANSLIYEDVDDNVIVQAKVVNNKNI